MLITGRSWTGHRTLDLAQLSRVRRVKWTFSGEYGSSIHVDYVTLTDRTGVRLSMPRRTALEPVQLRWPTSASRACRWRRCPGSPRPASARRQ